jgi:hypothetical protein
MPKPRDAFLLTLIDAESGDPEASPATNRLKRALKVLLRSFGLRCVRAELRPADSAEPSVDLTGIRDEAKPEAKRRR